MHTELRFRDKVKTAVTETKQLGKAGDGLLSQSTLPQASAMITKTMFNIKCLVTLSANHLFVDASKHPYNLLCALKKKIGFAESLLRELGAIHVAT
jgi:hypothetical protein